MAEEDITANEALEQVREEFAAVVAHDLRDPIQAILLDVELLRRNRGEGVSWTLVDRIERSARRLGQITHDLLDTVRLELRRLPLEREPVAVVAALQSLVRRMGPALGDHPVTIEAGEPVTILADLERFEQICANLIDNAAKYSPPGAPVEVRVTRADETVKIAVRDHGLGISATELQSLFDRYHQSKRARARKTGLGLGLYITRGLVLAHGGRLEVASEPGKGSTFTVVLPVGT